MTDRNRNHWTEDDVADVLTNPIYTGIGPYPRMVDDVTWVRAIARACKENGTQETVLRMLLLLREAFPPGTLLPPGTASPFGYTSPPK